MKQQFALPHQSKTNKKRWSDADFASRIKKMKQGTVKFFNAEKGFGFIKEEGGQDIFVHATGLQEEIRENDQVVFEVKEGKKGLNAVNVRLA